MDTELFYKISVASWNPMGGVYGVRGKKTMMVGREDRMVYTEVQAWLNDHELIECKPLKGRWTRKTCLEMSRRVRKPPRNVKTPVTISEAKTVPCANCPILAALEK
jgi:hypothetical protein